MLKRILAVFSVVLFCALLCAAGSKQYVRTNVPFDFYIGESQYPAGEYTLVLETGSPVVVLMSNDEYKAILSVNSVGIDNTYGNTHLVFAKDGDRNVLHQIWIGGENHGFDVLHKPDVEAPQIPRY